MTQFNLRVFEEEVRKDMYTRPRDRREMQEMIDKMHGIYQRLHQNELIDKGLAFLDEDNRFIVSYDGKLSIEQINAMHAANGL